MAFALSGLDLENSGLEEDSTRNAEQALELRMAGFTTVEKKLESLKQGGKCRFLRAFS